MTGISFFIKRNEAWIKSLVGKYKNINKFKYNGEDIESFIDKKYKGNKADKKNAIALLDKYFNKYKIPEAFISYRYSKFTDKDEMTKLLRKFFYIDIETTGNKSLNNLILFLNLKEISSIGVVGSYDTDFFLRNLVKGNTHHRMFQLYNNFSDEPEQMIKDTYFFIRTMLKKGSTINPGLMSNIFSKYEGENLLISCHSWMSPVLGAIKSDYKTIYSNDINYHGDRIDNLVDMIKNDEETKEFIEGKEVFDSEYDFTSKRYLSFYSRRNIDTVFVCPPYHDLESYGDNEKQSGDKLFEDYMSDMIQMLDNNLKIANKQVLMIIANTKNRDIISEFEKEFNRFESEYNVTISQEEVIKKANIQKSDYIANNGEVLISFVKK